MSEDAFSLTTRGEAGTVFAVTPLRPPLAVRAGGHIVVEGPIGVGKTSLAERLAEVYGAQRIFEQPQENPFIERFYQMRRQYALSTQLFFLFQRAAMLAPLRQQDLFRPLWVSDFLFEKDALFARVTLDDDEFSLYDQVYQQVAREPVRPDLVIYLQAPAEVLMDRIKRRGRDFERQLDRRYLEELVHAYTQFFYHYTDAPLLVVNATTANFVDCDADFEALLHHLQSIRSGRHFFNPLPMEL